MRIFAADFKNPELRLMDDHWSFAYLRANTVRPYRMICRKHNARVGADTHISP